MTSYNVPKNASPEGRELWEVVYGLLLEAEAKLGGLRRCLDTAAYLAEAELDDETRADMKALARAALTWEQRSLKGGSAVSQELWRDACRLAGEEP